MDERYSAYEAFLDNDGPPNDTDIENRGGLAKDANIGTFCEALDHGGMVGVRIATRTVGAVPSAPDVAHERRTTINMNILAEKRRRSYCLFALD